MFEYLMNLPWWVWCVMIGLAVMVGAVWFDTGDHSSDGD